MSARKFMLSALALLLLTTAIRGLGSLATLGVAYYAGAGLQMDYYVALSTVLGLFCALSASAVPAVLSMVAMPGESAKTLVRRYSPWARRIQVYSTMGYVGMLPVLSVLLIPMSADASAWGLALPLLLGVPCVWLAPDISLKQSALQAQGRLYVGVGCSALFMGTSLLSALASNVFGGVALCALGLSVGAVFEWLALRAVTSKSSESLAPEHLATGPLPWRAMLSMLGATAGFLLASFYDQALLVRMGEGVAATWGLATRAPAFVSMSVFAVAGILCSAALPGWRTAAPAAGTKKALVLFGAVLAGSALLMGGLAAAATPIVYHLFERGAFGPQETVRVAAVMQFAVLTFLLYPASLVLIRACVAFGLLSTLLASSCVFVLVKLVLAPPLVAWLAMEGVAYSTLAASVAQILVLAVVLSTRRSTLPRV